MALTQINSNSITDGSITNADISSSAAIDESKLTITSVGGANGVDFNDNVKARFGTGNDLEIYHDGTDSVIRDDSRNLLIRADGVSGDLYLQSDNQVILSDIGGNETFIECNDNSDVKLYHDNNVKLATTSTGINVTGTVTCDGLTSDGNVTIAATAPSITLKDTDSAGNACQAVIQANDSSNTRKWYIGDSNTGNSDFYIHNDAGPIIFSTNNTVRAYFETAGSLIPATNNSIDLGSASNQFRNGYFDGAVYTDQIVCDGPALIAAGTGELFLRDNDDVGNNAATSILRGQDSSGSNRWWIGDTSSGNTYLEVWNAQAGPVVFGTNNSSRCYVSSDGHFVPWSNNTYDLGTSSNRWRNVYTNDLNLSNEGGTNDVDGTWGSWTIQEGEDDLFLLNRRNGKKYKFNLTEVN